MWTDGLALERGPQVADKVVLDFASLVFATSNSICSGDSRASGSWRPRLGDNMEHALVV